MGYFILFAVVFVTVVLIKGKADKKKRERTDYNIGYDENGQPQKTGKIAELNRKMDEKTAWLEADTQRMKQERARRKAAKEEEKQAKLEFKNRNK